MMHSVTHILDCVERPRPEGKPHRRLSLEVVVDGESPHYCVMTCRDGDEVVVEAEIDVNSIELVVEIARIMRIHTRRSEEW
jgi:hypothetical protein